MKNLVCINCGSTHVQPFMDLGNQPNGNHFPAPSEIQAEIKFPFTMAVCKECWQVQIQESPSQEYMFLDHPYVTGLNAPVLTHFKALVETILFRYDIKPNSLVVDIGANDGTLLSFFRDKGMRVIGVDPCVRTNHLSSEKGITVAQQFWNVETAAAIKRLHLKPKLITATAVFYHVPSLNDFIKGLSLAMNPETVFIAQCVYMKDVLEKLQFDHFYHEHTMMHSIIPLKAAFARHGLKIIHVEMSSVHGGSFIVHAALDCSPFEVDKSVGNAIDAEIAFGMNNLATYLSFTRKVEKNRDDLIELLHDLKAQRKKVYALGAPLKGSTLLNYCGIGPDLVQYATELNHFKIGKVTPGTHIPVVDELSLSSPPDYYLVLSWNYLDYFMNKYSEFLDNGGKFIVPHPWVRIITR